MTLLDMKINMEEWFHMTDDKCYLCGSTEKEIQHGRVRDSKDIKVLKCRSCGLVFLSSFKHINNGFYESSGMLNGKVDIQKYRNDSKKDDLRRVKYLKEKISNTSVLDFGCGAGGFLHIIRDRCNKVAGVELDRKLNNIINMEGIKCYNNLNEVNEKYDLITLFHVLEHLMDPLDVLISMKKHLNPNGKIIIEVPNSDDALLTLYQNEDFKNFSYWSCHLFLYNSTTLKELLEKAGYKIYYIKQIQRYPLSNHLYWLSKGEPGGHKIYNFFNSRILDEEYESQLASIGKCDTLIAEISL